MRFFKLLSVTVLSLMFSFFTESVLSAGAHSYAGAVKIAAPSVLNVKTLRKVKVYRRRRLSNLSTSLFKRRKALIGYRLRSSLGSGVIIGKSGYALTNYHVVRNAYKISISLADGRKTEVKLIGSDPETDLAVLYIPLSHLHPAQLGNSDLLHVGDVVLAIGNPFGLGQTVTQGIISAIGRNTVGINRLENYIQTDAAINPGSSGGALVNSKGQVIGINTGIYSRTGGYQGVGFAIPINIAINVLQQIRKVGFVERGWIGVKIKTLNTEVARQLRLKRSTGVLVVGLVSKSPAGKAGVKPGDVITTVNTQRVRSARGFFNYVAQRKPGSSVELTVWRKQREEKISVVISKQPPSPSLNGRPGRLVRPEEVPEQRLRRR